MSKLHVFWLLVGTAAAFAVLKLSSKPSGEGRAEIDGEELLVYADGTHQALREGSSLEGVTSLSNEVERVASGLLGPLELAAAGSESGTATIVLRVPGSEDLEPGVLAETYVSSAVYLDLHDPGSRATSPIRAVPNAEGVVLLTGLKPGVYVPYIELSHNPLGLLEPRRPSPYEEEGRERLATAPLIESGGGTYELHLFVPASIEVHAPLGSEPGGLAGVRCTVPGFNQGKETLSVGPSGTVVFEGVLPGTYRATYLGADLVSQLEQLGKEAMRLTTGAMPRPVDLVAMPGQRVVAYLDGGVGESEVRARAVTGAGTPLADTDVLLYHVDPNSDPSVAPMDMRNVASWGRTGGLGGVVFSDLPATTYALQVAPGGSLPRRGSNERLLARPVERRVFTLKEGERRDEGDIVATLSRPVAVSGELILPAASPSELQEMLRLVRVSAFKEDPRIPSPGRIRSGLPVEVDSDGGFVVTADAGLGAFYLQLFGYGSLAGTVVFSVPLDGDEPVDLGPIPFP